MFASSGDSGQPCRVPSSIAYTNPSTMAPRRRYFPIKRNILQQQLLSVSILHRRDSQHPRSPARLGYLYPPHRRRYVGPLH